MELKIGDFAIINGYPSLSSPHEGAWSHEYKIKAIQPEGIYIEVPNEIGLSLIVFDSALNKWNVQNYLEPHEVTFRYQYIELTGIEEIDILILLELDADDLRNLCNDNLSNLCHNEKFWMFKVIKDFGQEVFQNKPPNETYKQQYWYLQQTFEKQNLLKPIKENRLDAILVLEPLIPNLQGAYKQAVANYASVIGNLRVLELLKKYDIFPFVFYSPEDKPAPRREVLEWALLQDQISKDQIYLSAVSNGYLDIIIKLDNMGFQPNNKTIKRAFERGRIEILEWLLSKGFGNLVHRYSQATIFGHLHVLNWMIDNGLLNINDQRKLIRIAKIAASYGHINILEWLEQMNIYPNDIKVLTPYLDMRDSINWIGKFTIPTLEWLKLRNLLPSTLDISNVFVQILHSKDFSLLNWLEENKIEFTYDDQSKLVAIRSAIRKKRLDILEWLEKRETIFTSDHANQAKRANADIILNWFIERGLYPTE